MWDLLNEKTVVPQTEGRKTKKMGCSGELQRNSKMQTDINRNDRI